MVQRKSVGHHPETALSNPDDTINSHTLSSHSDMSQSWASVDVEEGRKHSVCDAAVYKDALGGFMPL